MDRIIPTVLWAIVIFALSLTFNVLTAEANETRRWDRTVLVEETPTRRACPRVRRYTRDLGNCRQAWERDRPKLVLQPKRKTLRRKIVNR